MYVTFDFHEAKGPVKAMHAVGQPPWPGIDGEYLHYLTDAHIPYSRLHDMGGAFGGGVYVDIPNIFRDFSADENDPASYDFAFTDVLIKKLEEAHCQPVYRLGVTIENYFFVRTYRLNPPTDFGKWARICEHIIRHYNEGWADGFHFGITYWEIWNEPDNGESLANNSMWTGTPEQYFQLYEITAKHLKACFGNTIKVGGPASCGFYGMLAEPEKYGMPFAPSEEPTPRKEYFMTFALEFLDYVQKTGAPLDFFSWHSYASVEDTVKMARFVEKELASRGLSGIETQLNEWNNAPSPQLRGSSEACAKACAMLIAMQNETTDILCYYDARIGQSIYGGLFNPITYQPFCTYHAFRAFGELYCLGTQVTGGTAGDGVYAMAASDGTHRGILIANIGETQDITTDLVPVGLHAYLLDENHFLTEASLDPSRFSIGKYQVLFFSDKPL